MLSQNVRHSYSISPTNRILSYPECRRCESCIDRLFTLGPAPCPICQMTLRKLAFIPQTFEDLTVEKEVVVRRRMAKEFNKRREDFMDLRSYNDYLEEVEDISAYLPIVPIDQSPNHTHSFQLDQRHRRC